MYNCSIQCVKVASNVSVKLILIMYWTTYIATHVFRTNAQILGRWVTHWRSASAALPSCRGAFTNIQNYTSHPEEEQPHTARRSVLSRCASSARATCRRNSSMFIKQPVATTSFVNFMWRSTTLLLLGTHIFFTTKLYSLVSFQQRFNYV